MPVRRIIAVIASAVSTLLLAGCVTVGSTTAALSAESGCRAYLTAAKNDQDAAVKQIAVAQGDTNVLTTSGRPQVDTECAKDDSLTLGGAIGHASADVAKARTVGRSKQHVVRRAAGRRVVARHAARPAAPVRPAPPVQHQPTTPDELRSAFEQATSVSSYAYSGGSDTVYFKSPTGNIGCWISSYDGTAQCQIAEYGFDQPGPDCPRGADVSIDEGGSPSVPTCAPTDLYSSDLTTLEYGEALTNGNLACVSAPVGVSCLDLTSDRGFTVSREQYSPVG